MLVQLTTLFAQAKRKMQPILVAETASLEVAVAAVRAAEVQKRSLVLSIDATEPLLASLTTTVLSFSALAQESQVKIGVEVQVGAHHSALEQALYAGAIALTIQPREESVEQLLSLISWAKPQLAEVQAILGVTVTPALLEHPIHQSLSYCRAQLLRAHLPHNGLLPEQIADLQRVVHCPLIALEANYQPAELRRLAHLEISGVAVRSLLDRAYLAGWRTALHNRSLSASSKAVARGQAAVQTQVENLFQQLAV